MTEVCFFKCGEWEEMMMGKWNGLERLLLSNWPVEWNTTKRPS